MAMPGGVCRPPAAGASRTSAPQILILYPAEYTGTGGVVKGDPAGADA